MKKWSNIRRSKKLHHLLILITLLLIALTPGITRASAWTRAEGDVQLINNIFVYYTDTFFDVDGERLDQEDFVKVEYNPYLEVGITDDLTGGGSIRIQELSQRNAVTGVNDRNFGLSDVEIFVRQRVWHNEDTVFSVQPLFKFNGSFDNDSTPSLGQDQIDLELRGQLGHNFQLFDRPHYANVEVGYRKRMEAPSDELRLDAALGLRFSDTWMLLNEISNISSISDGDMNSFVSANSADFDLTKVQVSVVNKFTDHASWQVGGFAHVDGKNTGAGGGALFAIWYDLSWKERSYAPIR